MAFPTNTISTANVDSELDSPADARADILDCFTTLNAVINSYDDVSGIAALDATGKIVNTKLPNTLISSTGANLTLTPATNIVKINNVLELTPRTTAQLTALTVAEGTIAYCSDGDAGSKCIAVYDGSAWKVVSLGSTISAT